MRFGPVALVLMSTVLTSAAQVFYKFAGPLFPRVFTNWALIAGLACYGVSAALFVVALKRAEVSVVYPVFALSYVLVAVAAFVLFGESMTVVKMGGMSAVVAGVSFVGWGSRRVDG